MGLVRSVPLPLAFVLDLAPMALCSVSLASIFHWLPNAQVRWRDAIVGGMLGGIALELGKRGFAAYLIHGTDLPVALRGVRNVAGLPAVAVLLVACHVERGTGHCPPWPRDEIARPSGAPRGQGEARPSERLRVGRGCEENLPSLIGRVIVWSAAKQHRMSRRIAGSGGRTLNGTF